MRWSHLTIPTSCSPWCGFKWPHKLITGVQGASGGRDTGRPSASARPPAPAFIHSELHFPSPRIPTALVPSSPSLSPCRPFLSPSDPCRAWPLLHPVTIAYLWSLELRKVGWERRIGHSISGHMGCWAKAIFSCLTAETLAWKKMEPWGIQIMKRLLLLC